MKKIIILSIIAILSVFSQVKAANTVFHASLDTDCHKFIEKSIKNISKDGDLICYSITSDSSFTVLYDDGLTYEVIVHQSETGLVASVEIHLYTFVNYHPSGAKKLSKYFSYVKVENGSGMYKIFDKKTTYIHKTYISSTYMKGKRINSIPKYLYGAD